MRMLAALVTKGAPGDMIRVNPDQDYGFPDDMTAPPKDVPPKKRKRKVAKGGPGSGPGSGGYGEARDAAYGASSRANRLNTPRAHLHAASAHARALALCSKGSERAQFHSTMEQAHRIKSKQG